KYITDAHYDSFLSDLKTYIASGGNVIEVLGYTVDFLGYYNETKDYKSANYRNQIFNIYSAMSIITKSVGIKYSVRVSNNSHPITDIWSINEIISTEVNLLNGWNKSMVIPYIPTTYSVYNSSIPMWNLIEVYNETSSETLGYLLVVAKHPNEGARITIIIPYDYGSAIEKVYPFSMWKVFKRTIWWCLYGDSSPWIGFAIAPTTLITYRWDDFGYQDRVLDMLDWVETNKIPITGYICINMTAVGSGRTAVNWTKALQVSESSYTMIGSHTVTHPDLRTLTKSELIYQLNNSKQWIIGNLSLTEIYGLAYPYNYRNYTVDYYTSKFYIYSHGSIAYWSDYNHSEYLDELFTYYPLVYLRGHLGYGGVGTSYIYPYNGIKLLEMAYSNELPYVTWTAHEHNIFEDTIFKSSSEQFIDYIRNKGYREVYDYEVAMRVKELVENNFTVTFDTNTIKITLHKTLSYDHAITVKNIDKYVYSVKIDGNPWYAFDPSGKIILPKQFSEITITLSDNMPTTPRIQKSSHELKSTSFTDQRLSVVLEGPSGVTGTTVIYCPYDPIMIFEDGDLKTTGYTWNPDTKLLTINVTFSSPVKLDIYFAVPRVEGHEVKGMILGYVFPGTKTISLDVELHTEATTAKQDVRIVVEIYDSAGNLVDSVSKRETITQEGKTVTFLTTLDTGTYIVKVKLINPDTGETLDTYTFTLKVTYPWWIWATIIAIILISTATIFIGKPKRHTFKLNQKINKNQITLIILYTATAELIA
ncbi:MAG: hypothetical protein DRP08_06855, partial [Candidatus Aenigmatarchaeota archaeon]